MQDKSCDALHIVKSCSLQSVLRYPQLCRAGRERDPPATTCRHNRNIWDCGVCSRANILINYTQLADIPNRRDRGENIYLLCSCRVWLSDKTNKYHRNIPAGSLSLLPRKGSYSYTLGGGTDCFSFSHQVATNNILSLCLKLKLNKCLKIDSFKTLPSCNNICPCHNCHTGRLLSFYC